MSDIPLEAAEGLKIGVIDSGASLDQSSYIREQCRFVQNSAPEICLQKAVPDTLGHGTKINEIIHYHAPNAQLYCAQVFDGQRATTAAIIAAAAEWLIAQNVYLIHLSLGLREDREILRNTCQKAAQHNIIMVASSPAMGAVPYPAAYPDVIAVTGDARCKVGEIAFLEDSYQADFGGSPYGLNDEYGAGGSSMAAAHVTGHIAKFALPKEKIWDMLIKNAAYNTAQKPPRNINGQKT